MEASPVLAILAGVLGMIQQTFRGVMQGQTLVVLETAAPLADGTPVEVTPLTGEVSNTAQVLAAMVAEPPVSLEEVAELERAIAVGRRPRAAVDVFAQDTGKAGPS